MRSYRLRLITVLLAALALAWALWIALGPRAHRPRNVVVVLIDTLRADHLGIYGYDRPTSPFIDELARGGVVFDHAVSAAPATFPAINSLFTSQHPATFYHTNRSNLGIPEQMTTLAESLNGLGFRTGAVSASPIVRKTPSHYNERGGFGQGFEVFDETCSSNARRLRGFTAPCVTNRAIALLNHFGKAPFFLYLHYLDPHDPYQPPPAENRFGTEYAGKQFVANGFTTPIVRWLYEGGNDPGLTAEDLQHLIDLYDGEIRAVDKELGRLTGELARREILDNTLLIILSDHGESFMQHRHIQHGRSAYQSELHIPLIFHWPENWSDGVRRSEPVCTIDVTPTILSLLWAPVPAAMRGRPLFGPREDEGGPCLSAGRANWRAQEPSLWAVRLEDQKLIRDATQDGYELYDLASDPGEQHNLITEGADDRPVFTMMKELLESWRRVAVEGEPTPSTLDPDTERTLQALGYLE